MYLRQVKTRICLRKGRRESTHFTLDNKVDFPAVAKHLDIANLRLFCGLFIAKYDSAYPRSDCAFCVV